VEAQLAKHVVAWSKDGQVIGGREVTLSNVNFIKTDTSQEGLAVSYFELVLGEPGKEQSWKTNGVLEVAVSLLRIPTRVFPSRLKPGLSVFDSSHGSLSRRRNEFCTEL
jgi:hypothetical protein